ncbi:unnamed protein product [Schistocephalus solidus]|uniref:C2H2-type domain-containing protein n=1 Tax=Schistocephalus solidus TaxID=70667 RepID=A0A183TAX8_SCHSO|nr:unnamed protein product [Schistocephalus solidus]
MQCTNNPTIPISTSNSTNPPSDSPTLTLGINSIIPTIIETTSLYSWPVTPNTATTTAFAFTTNTTISDGESLLSCPQCDRTFTSRIGLVGHLRIHRTETAPSHSRDRCLHCPHCPRALNHRMGLFGHMRINDSGIHHNADNTDTPCTPSAPAILSVTATPTTMNDILPASTYFSCPHCARNFNSRIGLVGHLRIHRTEAGEPVPGSTRPHSLPSLLPRIYTPHGPITTHAPPRKPPVNSRRLSYISAHYLHQYIDDTLTITIYQRISRFPRNRGWEVCQSDASTRPRRQLSVCAVCAEWLTSGLGVRLRWMLHIP